jgi:hypothetical protein
MSAPSEAPPTAQASIEFPARDGYRAVAGLVLGGVAARFDLPVDRVDDLLLGVDSLLMQGVSGETARVETTASETELTVRVGTFAAGRLEDVSLRRVVSRLVDTVKEVPVEGGDGAWIELGMRVAARDGA